MPLRLLCSIAFFVLSACGSLQPQTSEWPDQELYQTAQKALKSGNYPKAITNLEDLDGRYPFSPLIPQAHRDLVYAYYQQRDFPAAITAADRFLALHPTDPGLDYIYYLRGMTHLKKGYQILASWFPRDYSGIDQEPLHRAFDDFRLIDQRFPDSLYLRHARQWTLYLRNKIAEQKLRSARYYYHRSAFIAAINDLQRFFSQHPTSPHKVDALALLIRCYERLKMPDIAADIRTILAANAPTHPLLKESSAAVY